MTKSMTSAQKKQQNNRTSDGKYTTKAHSEADVALLNPTSAKQDYYNDISDELGRDLMDYTRRSARAVMNTKSSMRDSAHDPDDLAQETVLAVLERYEKDGGKNIGSIKSWLNRTMKNKVTRMGEGKFHWPNSVAIRQYNELIAAREQEHGTMSSAEKDKLRHHLLENWDELNPTMKRHRPQSDFHLYTYKNTAVRLDGLVDNQGEVGNADVMHNYLNENASDVQNDSAEIEMYQAIQELEDINPKAVSDGQIASARYAYDWLTDGNAPQIQPTMTKAEFDDAFKTLGVSTAKSSDKATQAVLNWEQGDYDEDSKESAEILALMKPFGGEENLSMSQQQEVINTLTRHGRDAHHVNKMWSISALSARASDQHTAVAPQKKSTNAA